MFSELAYRKAISQSLLKVVSCPICHGDLTQVSSEDIRAVRFDGAKWNGNADLTEAEFLSCQCKAVYPIIDGVPRLFQGAVMQSVLSDALGGAGTRSVQKTPDDFDGIRESFTKEWEVFDYASDKTWGWTLEERKRIFLTDTGFSAGQLAGKVMLDAGCGNGTLTAALSTLAEVDIVGVDLNEQLGKANQSKSQYGEDRSSRVHFVQGNLFSPPFKPQSFDLIYSSGVIHHTPNSRKTFEKLVPLVKRGGRLYVWVYGKRSLPVTVLAGSGRQLKRFMSLQALLKVCRISAPAYKVITELLNACGIAPFRRRTTREITLDLFDAWAPQYNHRHTVEEVTNWFKESGFSNVTPSGKQKHGFGVYGDKI